MDARMISGEHGDYVCVSLFDFVFPDVKRSLVYSATVF